MSFFTDVLKTVKTTSRSVAKHTLMKVFAVVRVLPKEVGRSVLLTFDDGPNNEVTPSVLDRLRQCNARAVFFVQGRFVVDAPDLLQLILKDGHVIANHTFTHDNSMPYRDYVADIARCQKVVEERTGARPRLFRPPHGRISPGILCAAYANQVKPVIWSATGSADWDPRQTETSAARALGEWMGDHVKPRDIILLHDDDPRVLVILDVLLPRLSERGLDLSGAVEHL